jgi:heme-degrading monooxygenase HmoA
MSEALFTQVCLEVWNSPKFAPHSGGWHHSCGGRVGPLEGKRATKEACPVYARISTLEGPPELMDESLRLAREVVLPQGRLMEGFKGMIALGDRHSGRTLGITFWESEEAMRTSEEAAKRLREESAKAGGDTIASVERYEVGLFEVES